MSHIVIESPKDRELYLVGEVNQESVQDVIRQIREINESDASLRSTLASIGGEYKPDLIRVNIDSYGGCVYSGLGLIGEIENSLTPIHTHVMGAAMSMGMLILSAGDVRTASTRSTIMVHQISAGASGKVQDIKENLDHYGSLQNQIEGIILEKTKIKPKKLAKLLKSKQDWYLTPEQALKVGLIDHIYSNNGTEEENNEEKSSKEG